jgi:hypothetical protein
MTEQDAKLRLALRSYSAHLSAATAPPPVETVWLRARQRERQLALQRTAYPLRAMYAITVIAAVLACAWFFHTTTDLPNDPTWAAALHSSAAKWLVAGLLAALAGWTLLFRATQRLFTV